jgi:hypothetical protein
LKVTDFRLRPESSVMIAEWSVTFGRNKAEFVLELTFYWLSFPFFSGRVDASQTECHAQDQRGSAPQI